MALFKILKGRSENLGKTNGTDKTKEGYAYFTPDDGKFYIDIADSDQVKVGISSQDGANRICINGNIGGSFFDPNEIYILNCGTAKGHTVIVPPETKVLYFDCGDSEDEPIDEANILECGDSNDELAINIIYNCGDAIEPVI